MGRKSGTPKEGESLFKFVSFNDRLSSISITAIDHQARRIATADSVGILVSHLDYNPDEGSDLDEIPQTHTAECLSKWTELNHTADMERVRLVFGPLRTVSTLPQILLRKDELITGLQQEIMKHGREHKALDAILELLASLARDLQKEFYPYFIAQTSDCDTPTSKDLFETIVDLLYQASGGQPDAELLERCFTCLAFCVKFLWRYLAQNYQLVFSRYCDKLLKIQKISKSETQKSNTGTCRDFIRRFSAESLSYLFRKVSDRTGLISLLLGSVQQDPSLTHGVSHVLFQILKGVTGRLHSVAEQFIAEIINCYLEIKSNSEDLHSSLDECMKSFYKELTAYVTHQEHMRLVYKPLNIEKRKHNLSQDQLYKIALLLDVLIRYRQSQAINADEKLFGLVNDSLQSVTMRYDGSKQKLGHYILDTYCQFLLSCFNMMLSDDIQKAIKSAFTDGSYTMEHLSLFVSKLLKGNYAKFERDILPSLVVISQLQTVTIKSAREDLLSNWLQIWYSIISHKRTRPICGVDFKIWSPYQIDYSMYASSGSFVDMMDNEFETLIQSAWKKLWLFIAVRPHIRPYDRQRSEEMIQKLLKFCCESMDQHSDKDDKKHEINQVGLVLSQALLALTLHGDKNQDSCILQMLDPSMLPNLVMKNANSITLLQAYDFYLTLCSKSKLTEVDNLKGSLNLLYLEQLYGPVLSRHLESHSSTARLLSLHIINVFKPPLPPDDFPEGDGPLAEKPQQPIKRISVVEICLKSELIPLDVINFKEKLKHIRDLEFRLVQNKIPIQGTQMGVSFDLLPVRYLLGVSYVNFRPIWDVIKSCIASYAMENPAKDSFVQLIFDHLTRTNEIIQTVTNQCDEKSEEKTTVKHIIWSLENNQDDRPDHLNHRLLLWESLGSIATIVEPQNRLLVRLFLDFYHKELFNGEYERRRFWLNVKKQENGTQNQDEDEEHVAMIQPNRKFLWRTLIGMLDTFSKLPNLRSVYRCNEMDAIYNFLLTNSDSAVQRAAFNCLAAYRNKQVTPYLDLIQDVINDKTFADAILVFMHTPLPVTNQDSDDDDDRMLPQEQHETPKLDPAHRSAVIPILTRILYGKLLSKAGSRKLGRGRVDTRHKIVLRFFASCTEQEGRQFLELIFESIMEYMRLDYAQLLSHAGSLPGLDLEKASKFPLGRLASAMEHFGTLMKYVGNVLPGLHTTMLRIILTSSCLVNSFLLDEDLRDQLNQAAIGTLKTIRTTTYNLLIYFFENYDLYAFSEEEIKILFSVMVTPYLQSFQDTAYSAQTPLFRLFMAWGQNSRYFPLLMAVHLDKNDDDECHPDLYPMKVLMDLYRSERTSRTIAKQINSLLVNLLTFSDQVKSQEVLDIKDLEGMSRTERKAARYRILEELNENDERKLGDPIPVPALSSDLYTAESNQEMDRDETGQMDLGKRIVATFVDDILDHFLHLSGSEQFSKTDSTDLQRTKTKSSAHKYDQSELQILSAISSQVSEAVKCAQLAGLLLKSVRPPGSYKTRNEPDEESQVTTLETVAMLVCQVSRDPKLRHECIKLARQLAPMFGFLIPRLVREAACDILLNLANDEKYSKFYNLARLVTELNAYHPARLEEPDFERRLDAFKEFNDMFREKATKREDESDEDIFTLGLEYVIYNSFATIRTALDMSLRDAASYCIQNLIQQLGPHLPEHLFHRVIIGLILKQEVANGLRHKTEMVRHEIITILVSLINSCATQDSCLASMATLACPAEPEVDFWENIKHIQVHRRGRALGRVVKVLQNDLCMGKGPNKLKKADRDDQNDKDRMSTNEQHINLNGEVLSSYLIPLVMNFVTDLNYADRPSLQENAIKFIGLATRLVPWQVYNGYLSQFLNKMSRDVPEQRKLTVKLLSEILTNFNYDLSASTLVVEDVSQIFQPEKRGKAKNKKFKKDREMTHEEEQDLDALVPRLQENSDQQYSLTEVIDKRQKPSSKLATAIHRTIVSRYIPELMQCLHERSVVQADNESVDHQSKTIYADPEDDVAQRVPLAIALIRLLQCLPNGDRLLAQNVTGILLRLTNFLASHNQAVRDEARQTLSAVMAYLGPHFFPHLLNEMKSLLTKGYQLHVLTFTLHTILKTLASQGKLTPGDLDPAVVDIVEICNGEIFARKNLDRKKDTDDNRHLTKSKEAKACKSFDTYSILAGYISYRSLPHLMGPIQMILKNTTRSESVKKSILCLERVSAGLISNKGISQKDLLVFIYGLITESIPSLIPRSGKSKGQEEEELKNKKKLPYERQDMFLLDKANKSSYRQSRTSTKTNDNLLVEFGLSLLSQVLKAKRDKETESKKKEIEDEQETGEETELKGLLDPLVPVLIKCSESSQFPRMTVIAERCLIQLIKRFTCQGLPQLIRQASPLAKSLFYLLSKYCGTGMAQSTDNWDLVVQSFKLISLLLCGCSSAELSLDLNELRVLLIYVDNDLNDISSNTNSRQPTTFNLLKAILSRHLTSPELIPTMDRVSQLAITSHSDYVRSECRSASIKYLLAYYKDIGSRKWESHLANIVANLEYEHETGRESALELLKVLISAAPCTRLQSHMALIFVPLAARLVNEESIKCRKLVYHVLKNFLSLIDGQKRRILFSDMVLAWFKSSEGSAVDSQKVLAIQLIGLWIEIEGGKFEDRLALVVPDLVAVLNPEECQLSEDLSGISELNNDRVKGQDNLIYQTLTTLRKLFQAMPKTFLMGAGQCADEVHNFWTYLADYHLLHPHAWIRLLTTQLYGMLFAAYHPTQLATVINSALENGASVYLDDSQTNVSSGLSKKRRNRKSKIQNQTPGSESDNQTEPAIGYLATQSRVKIWKLTQKFCLLLRSLYLLPSLGDQLVKNLVYIGRIAMQLNDNLQLESTATHQDQDEQDMDEDVQLEDANKSKVRDQHRLPLIWIARRIIFEAKTEVALNTMQVLKREAVFKWIAALVLELQNNESESSNEKVSLASDRLLIAALIRPLCREMCTNMREDILDETALEIRRAMAKKMSKKRKALNGDLEETPRMRLTALTRSVVDLLRNTLGYDLFTQVYAEEQARLSSKRTKRKQEHAAEVINNPIKATKRRIAKNEQKRESKRRKVAHRMHGGRVAPLSAAGARFKPKRTARN